MNATEKGLLILWDIAAQQRAFACRRKYIKVCLQYEWLNYNKVANSLIEAKW